MAQHLSQELGQSRVLYDTFHEAEFARPNLDTHLQALYHNESELVVVFLSADYERKEWPGLEWRAIRDLIKKKQASSIMLIRLDDASISGLFTIDGYISAQGRVPTDIAMRIIDRLQILKTERKPLNPTGSIPPAVRPSELRPTLSDIRIQLNQALVTSYNQTTPETEQYLRQITGSLQQLLVDAVRGAEEDHLQNPNMAEEAVGVLS